MNARHLALVAPILAIYTAVLTFLVADATLLSLLPFDARAMPWPIVFWLVLTLALTPTLFTRGSPLPMLMIAYVPAVAVALYDQSHLDWLRTLKDFDVASPGAVRIPRLALAVVAFVLAWTLHAADLILRLRDGSIERGVSTSQANLVMRRALVRTAMAVGAGLAGAAGIFAVVLVADAIPLPAERGAFLVPIVAAALVALGAVLLVWRRPEASTVSGPD